MDLRFTIAILMFVVIGCLQAVPIPPNLIKLLEKDGRCEDNVNFTTPTNVKEDCLGAALETIIGELTRAQNVKECKLDSRRLDQVLESWRKAKTTAKLQVTNSTDCNWEGSHKNFKDFMTAVLHLVTNINTVIKTKK